MLYIGKVGLMYPSDYGYASGNDCATNTSPYNYDAGCGSKDWLNASWKEWTMTPYSNTDVYHAHNVIYGRVSYSSTLDPSASRPTFYLKSDISITGGTGTSTDPYTVE